MMRPTVRLCAAACLAALLFAAPAAATVFHARDEAIELAFPGATRTEARDFFLTAEQRRQIEEQSKSGVESDLLTVYAGYDGERLLGWAIFDTHIVRTLPETFLVVLTPGGAVAATHVLAFYEPLEYLPSDRWLAQFQGKQAGDDLHVGRGIAAITGSTLSSQAVAAGIRRALAIHAVLLPTNLAHGLPPVSPERRFIGSSGPAGAGPGLPTNMAHGLPPISPERRFIGSSGPAGAGPGLPTNMAHGLPPISPERRFIGSSGPAGAGPGLGGH